MKIVKKLKWIQERLGKDGAYYLHTYKVEDDLGNIEEIDTLQEFKPGDRVETWFDGKYNKPKMRLYKEVRKNEPDTKN